MTVRIAVLGNSASGKSTFSAWLATQLDLPVLHLDRLIWQPGWTARGDSELAPELDRFMNLPGWIIDGMGSRELVERRVTLANTVVLFDLPVSECLRNAALRAERQKEVPNKFIGEGLSYAAVWDRQCKVIRWFEQEWMPWLRRRANEDGWIHYRSIGAAYADRRWCSASGAAASATPAP